MPRTRIGLWRSESSQPASGPNQLRGDSRHLVRSRTGRQFDSILYMDFLEHIEAETQPRLASSRVASTKPSGTLVILSPATANGCSPPSTAAIGHYRRYSKNSLRSIVPGGLRETKCIYLDSAGLFGVTGEQTLSCARPYPSKAQNPFWDRALVPISRATDPRFEIRDRQINPWNLQQSPLSQFWHPQIAD